MNTFPVFAVFNSSVKSNIAGLEDYHGFIEVVPIESGKSNAIKFLAQKEKILPEKIVTIGDGLNDLGMVRDFDGFAIEKSELSNADINLKAASSLAKLVENIL
ncbi:HAD hydrolase family protein [Candidatus Saccharibacteria bacterium]|nr:HAD hydrolase family protein [Candidatus Saccharibacteria bacterium]